MHRPLAVLLVLAPGLSSGTLSAQDAAAWMLPPSSAAPIGAVAGMGEGPIAGCALVGVSIDRDRARATYTCDGAAVIATLTRGPRGDLVVGTAPRHDALERALGDRARDVSIPWTRIHAPTADRAPPPRAARSDPRGYALGVLTFAALFAVVIAWTRPR